MSSNSSLLSNVKQLFLIVFSVVLGIYLSERIEDSKQQKEANLLLEKIGMEVSNNRALLEEWTPYHLGILHRLDSLIDEEQFVNRFVDSRDAMLEVLTEGTIMRDSPSDDAWDIAKSHPLIVYFDYDDMLVLSKAYSQQALTYESVPQVIQLMIATDFNDRAVARQNLQSFYNLMQEVVGREVQLLNYVRAADMQLDS